MNTTIVHAGQLRLQDIPDEVELYSDPSGSAGRAFGVSTGWRPDDAEMSPYVKLLGMLVGLGAWVGVPTTHIHTHAQPHPHKYTRPNTLAT